MCTHQKRYMFLVIDNREKDAWLLGYPMRLSPTELKIMNLIYDKRTATTNSMFAALSPDVTKSSIPVHINSINKKAMYIGGRKILIFRTGHYRFNSYM